MREKILRDCFVFSLLVPFFVLAYVNPGTPRGFVSDFAEMLPDAEERLLEEKLAQFERDTSSEIAIVTIASLQGEGIENFAIELFEDWQIGKADKDNGILVLVARDDRAVRIEVGYGLEGTLTDGQSGWIIDAEIIPRFREEMYLEGLDGAAERIMAAIRGEYVPSAETLSRGTLAEASSYLAIPIFFALSILLHVFGRTKSWWLGGVLGGLTGVLIGVVGGSFELGLGGVILFIPIGLLIDFWASRAYHYRELHGAFPWWWTFHGRTGGGDHDGFGGFGGGMSGGGGASRRW